MNVIPNLNYRCEPFSSIKSDLVLPIGYIIAYSILPINDTLGLFSG